MTGEWLVDQLFAKPQQLRRFAPWLEERDIKTLTRPEGLALHRQRRTSAG